MLPFLIINFPNLLEIEKTGAAKIAVPVFLLHYSGTIDYRAEKPPSITSSAPVI